MEIVVQRCEEHDHQTDDKGCLYESERYAEKFVEPSKHHEVEDSFEESADEAEDNEYSDHYERKCYDRKNVFRSLDILSEPFPDRGRKFVRHPYAGYKRHDRYHLTYKAFPDSADQGRHEAN